MELFSDMEDWPGFIFLTRNYVHMEYIPTALPFGTIQQVMH